jgi:hypothetical protein
MKHSIVTAVTALALVVAGSLLFCGCEPSTVKLTQGYRLERFDENGKYYVISPENLPGGGVFDGTVEQIGWNQDWILARVTKLYHGDTNGWYALDLKTRHVVGPIQESDVKTNAAWSKIGCRDAEQVFLKK